MLRYFSLIVSKYAFIDNLSIVLYQQLYILISIIILIRSENLKIFRSSF